MTTQLDAPLAAPGKVTTRDRRRIRVSWAVTRLVIQLACVAGFLLAWEYVPRIPGIAGDVKWLDPFFISAPSRVAESVWDLVAGNVPGASLWSYLYTTLFGTIVGATIGLVLGALAGLILSNSPKLSDVLRPFIVILNSVPRVALIPVIVILVGPSRGPR